MDQASCHALVLKYTLFAGPDPEMLLLVGGGGGTESRNLEPSDKSREGWREYERGVEPPLIRGTGRPLSEIFCNIYVSSWCFGKVVLFNCGSPLTYQITF